MRDNADDRERNRAGHEGGVVTRRIKIGPGLLPLSLVCFCAPLISAAEKGEYVDFKLHRKHDAKVNLSKVTLGVVAVLFVVVVAGFTLQWQTNNALWQSIENSQGPLVGRASTPVSSVESRSARASDKTDLARLREEVSELRARTAALARLSVRAAESSSPPLNLMPSSSWKNAGRSTPASAAETFFWATDSGNVEVLAGAITLDQAAREKAEAILARMPDSVRVTYDTPEKLVALLLARESDIRAMQVLGENTSGEEALVNLRMLKDDGKTKDEGLQFRRSSDGWRMNVTGKVVDKMGKKLTDQPKKDGKK